MAFTYEIVKPIAKIGSTGELAAELNLIRFNGRAEKYDSFVRRHLKTARVCVLLLKDALPQA